MAAVAQAASPRADRFVLPTELVPKNYALHVTPSFDKTAYTGEVTVDLEVAADTNRIVFNAMNVALRKAVVEVGGKKTDVTAAATEKKDEERFYIALPFTLKKGTGGVRLHVEYTAEHGDKNVGFYRSKYSVKQPDGKAVEKLMVATHMEPVDARQVLPCWDEPLLKATFDVSLTVPAHMTALANTDAVATETKGATKTVRFARTPSMSTYLLAFCVGELEYVEQFIDRRNGSGQTRVRVYVTEGKTSKAGLALEVCCASLKRYEDFFACDYPISKCDFIGLPDFAMGAMENWGLVTFRETALLADDNSSFRSKLWVAMVAAHEVAHFWFGNLVTMEWWTELWLNESFATFMQFDIIDQLRPTWQTWATFVAEDYNGALRLDALESSHPIEANLRHAREIQEIFDAISYAKGCSLMRMCVAWIGQRAFEGAMRAYMAEFAYRNATTADLWRHLGAASGKPVAEVMSTWTQKQGYPLLSVRRAAPGKLVVRQRRFLSSGGGQDDPTVWQIPMRVATDAGDFDVLLNGREAEVAIPEKATWAKLNVGQTALVRVEYEPALLQALVGALEERRLSNLDVVGLVSDTEALASVGVVSATAVLKVCESAMVLHDMTVATAVLSALRSVGRILNESDAASRNFDGFKRALLARAGEELGWEARPADDERTKQLRGMVVGHLAGAGSAGHLAEARRRFDLYLETRDEAVLPADLRGAVFSAVVKADPTAAAWERLAELHEAPGTDPTEVARCCMAMAASRNPDVVRRTLAYAFDEKRTRPQNTVIFLRGLSANRVATEAQFEFITSEIATIGQRSDAMLVQVLGTLNAPIRKEHADRLLRWWETVDPSVQVRAQSTIKQCVEDIRNAAAFRERSAAELEKYLEQYA